MPLPDGGGAWPPAHLAPILDKLAEWAAWYSGDPAQLSEVYGGKTSPYPFDPARFNRPSQYRGGVAGRLARWWWGEPVPVGERSTKLHLPAAADIAQVSANLLFSEPPTITVEDTPTQDRLNELIEQGLHASLAEAAEICAALGGVYLRTCWDREVRDGPWIDAVHPDAAVPEWRWGVLTAVTFWRVIADDGRGVVRHLERHEPGRIEHAVYEGTPENLGRRVPLTEYPETAPLAEAVTDGDVIETGARTLTATYIPNMRPSRIWRRVPAAAPLGRSDYAGAEQLLDALDEVYSSLMRDVRAAKARLIVPASYLENLGPGQGAAWADREVYEALDVLAGGDRMELAAHQFAIRVQEHLTAADHLLQRIIHAAGYSAQTFGTDADGAAITATEVRAKERRSMTTRGKKALYWRPGLRWQVLNLLEIDASVFGSRVEPAPPSVAFGDSISEDLQTLAETAKTLREAEAASTEVIVPMLHPDWDDEQIRQEVERVKAERGMPVPDPLTIRPLGADLPPDEQLDDEPDDEPDPDSGDDNDQA